MGYEEEEEYYFHGFRVKLAPSEATKVIEHLDGLPIRRELFIATDERDWAERCGSLDELREASGKLFDLEKQMYEVAKAFCASMVPEGW